MNSQVLFIRELALRITNFEQRIADKNKRISLLENRLMNRECCESDYYICSNCYLDMDPRKRTKEYNFCYWCEDKCLCYKCIKDLKTKKIIICDDESYLCEDCMNDDDILTEFLS